MSVQNPQRQSRFPVSRHHGLVRESCSAFLPEGELLAVEAGNLSQDLWQHKSEFHFDNCAFDEGSAYYQELWEQIRRQAASQNRTRALRAFGKLLHLVEDFYSHSNWVELHAPQGAIPLWDMKCSSLPPGITSGTYGIGSPKRCRGAARLAQLLGTPGRGARAPVQAKAAAQRGGSAMADQWVKVRVNSIHVEKSESYGWWGEPGVEAEWRLFIDVNGHQRLWVNDHVRDRRNYPVGWDFYAGPMQSTSILTLRVTGYELDDLTANDPLPSAERIHGTAENWGMGLIQSLCASDQDFHYTLYYEVSLLNAMQLSSIPKKQLSGWVAERRAGRGHQAQLNEHELVSVFINKATQRGFRALSVDGDVLVFEGPAPIQAFIEERLPFVAERARKRFGAEREAPSAPPLQ
jgi:hypothetical protein